MRVKAAVLAALFVFLAYTGCAKNLGAPAAKKELPPMKKTDFVNLQQYIPSLVVELAYYTDKNFTGQKLYDSPRADRDYRDVSPEKKKNSLYLESVMTKHGFVTNRTEWWHFTDSEKNLYNIAESVSPGPAP
ncbi:MAG: M15 family metallopeptidase [Bacillota bacterium]